MPPKASFDAVAMRSTSPPSPGLVEAFQPFESACLQPRPIAIRELHPTQLTVGYREVAERRRRWSVGSKTVDSAARSLIVPVVLGPCAQSYILDRHHQLCALAAEGVADVQVSVVDDMRRFEWVGFWRTLDRRGWCRPFDAAGQRQDYSYIPTTIDGLIDDSFRSLARALRRAGGYAKQQSPFSDFLWSDFLRQRISRTLVNDDFEAALREALSLARNDRSIPRGQGTKMDARPKAPELSSNFSAPGLLDVVSAEAARERTAVDNTGTVT